MLACSYREEKVESIFRFVLKPPDRDLGILSPFTTFQLRNRHVFALDTVLLSMAPALALIIRLERPDWGLYWQALIIYTVGALIVKLAFLYFFGLYRRYWRFASVDELFTIIIAVSEAMALIIVVFLVVQTLGLLPGEGLPRSVPFIDGMLSLMVAGGTRFLARAVATANQGRSSNKRIVKKPVLVVGAGAAGEMVVREMKTSALCDLEPVCFVDDDPQKQGISIHKVPVLGTRQDIPRLVRDHGIQEVIIAMNVIPGQVIRETIALCEEAGVSYKTIPGMYELLSGQVRVSHLRDVDIEDLLRREPVEIDTEEVNQMLAGTRVMVTGAGGSIGSEICRQIIRARPARLTLLGHGENSLFMVSHDLRKMMPDVPIDIVVADVRDFPRMDAVFRRCRPQIVIHAAAHKHVPMMEDNIEDAVTTNVVGTRNLVILAEKYDVERFVFISTDKAVNPVNVMGTTKRLAELIVQQGGRRTGRPFISVRFGNVLGSRGSVVPLFRQQIAAGGPVTVTHPEVSRYFMTIPEAVQLVLQAAAMGENGQVFVLDMGEPIKIVDLARDLIELSGLKPYEDIDIVFTGLRPGEKIREELFAEGEEYHRTKHGSIFVAKTPDDELSEVVNLLDMDMAVDELIALARAGDEQRLYQKGAIVNTEM